MSQESLSRARHPRVAAPMAGRDPEEQHRASTPLELFFDLVFVVAVSLAADRFHHGLAEGHVARSILDYVLVFFAIWWGWVNFTWFASAYDTDDIVYRLFVFVTMTGALVIAAGIPSAFDERNYKVVVVGYVVMRIALVTQWLRASRHDAPRRTTARRYAAGVTACQVGWIAAVFVPPEWWFLPFAMLAPVEMLVPLWAESASPTGWHAEHIAERYGLFMIIVLGESVLATSLAIQVAVADGGITGELATVVAGGLLTVYALWWLYFDRPEEHLPGTTRAVFVWGYLHFVAFAAVAAVGAGLSVAIERASHGIALGPTATRLAVAVPVALVLFAMWALHVQRDDPPLRRFGTPATAVLVLVAAVAGAAVPLIGALLVAYVALKVRSRLREDGRASDVE